MIVKIFDDAFGHEKYCGHKIGRNESQFIEWDRSRMVNDGDVVVFTDRSLNYVGAIRSNAKKIAWLIEPPCVCSPSYEFIRIHANMFDHVLTHQEDMLGYGDNIIMFPMGYTLIYPEKQKIYDKKKNISIIASAKRDHIGHRLRHEVIDRFRNELNLDVYGGLTSGNSGYNPIADKSDGLADYRFSIVIENDQSPHYFSEKIVDCFMCGTIPVYWGAQKISEYFDISGILTFDTIEEFENLIPQLTEEKYQEMKESVVRNYDIAQGYKTVEDRIYEKLLR